MGPSIFTVWSFHFFCFYNWLFKTFTFWALLCLKILQLLQGRLSHQEWPLLIVKETHLAALKPDKAALLIILFQSLNMILQCSYNLFISRLWFYVSLLWSIHTVWFFSQICKILLPGTNLFFASFLSSASYSIKSCHQLPLDSAASNYIQICPPSSWYSQHLYWDETFFSYS